MEADKCWATGPNCGLEDKSGKVVFLLPLSRSSAPVGMFFGSFRLIVCHKLSSWGLVKGLYPDTFIPELLKRKYRKV